MCADGVTADNADNDTDGLLHTEKKDSDQIWYEI